MKNTIKLFLAIVLFCTTVFADGSMGNGGFTDDGSMGNGGKTCTGNCISNNPTTTAKNETETVPAESVLDFIQDYLISLFG